MKLCPGLTTNNYWQVGGCAFDTGYEAGCEGGFSFEGNGGCGGGGYSEYSGGGNSGCGGD